jgi:hypothetical protein
MPQLSMEDSKFASSVSSTGSNALESPVSSSFPTFANPPEGGTISIDPDGVSIMETTSHPPMGVLGPVHSLPNTATKDPSDPWPGDDGSDFEYGKSVEQDDEDYKSGAFAAHQMPGLSRAGEHHIQKQARQLFPDAPLVAVLERKTQRHCPGLAPAIWRMILFQW